VLVQVIQILRLLLDLAGVFLVGVCIISFYSLSLVFVLLFVDNLFCFDGLFLLLVFFWALLWWGLPLRRRLLL
jgi:hypothetical protein